MNCRNFYPCCNNSTKESREGHHTTPKCRRRWGNYPNFLNYLEAFTFLVFSSLSYLSVMALFIQTSLQPKLYSLMVRVVILHVCTRNCVEEKTHTRASTRTQKKAFSEATFRHDRWICADIAAISARKEVNHFFCSNFQCEK